MCGIVGKVMAPGCGPVDRELLERMCAALEHRGPDSRGLFQEQEAGLGIQRLRVVDLVTGDQPISNEDGSVVVVLNGEIYNFQELREDLRAGAIGSRPRATPRSSCTSTRSTAATACGTCTACSRSRSGTNAAGGCCWRGTGSARSRSSTPSVQRD